MSVRKERAPPPGSRASSAGNKPISASPTLREVLHFAVKRFRAARLSFGHGTTGARDEAAYLLLHAMELPPHELTPYLDRRLTKAERGAALRLVERRVAERLPSAYLTHEAWLAGHRFYVDERVIVPRSFIAELLPEGLDPWLAGAGSVRSVLDLCTGSGCLAILAALAYAKAKVDATDVSMDALKVARRNVDEFGLAARVQLVKGDLFGGVAARRYHLIIANPPYVDADSMRKLPAEYRKEPKLALAAGKDGLAIVNRILRQASRHLHANGILVVEIGHHRALLEATYPRLEFTWLDVAAGGEFVFLLTAEQLRAYRFPAILPLRSK